MNPPGPNVYFMALQAGFLPFEPDWLEYRQILIAGFIFVEFLWLRFSTNRGYRVHKYLFVLQKYKILWFLGLSL